MVSWREIHGEWAQSGESIASLGKGAGTRRLVMAVRLKALPRLNGQFRCMVNFKSSPVGSTVGVVARQRESLCCLLGGLSINQEKRTAIIFIGHYSYGEFTIDHAIDLPLAKGIEAVKFDLVYTAERVALACDMGDLTKTLEASVFDVCLPGCEGVFGFANSTFTASDFASIETAKVRQMSSHTDKLYEFDVFLSHSKEDHGKVAAFAKEMRQQGIRYWFDDEQIGPGSSISKEIDEGIRKSRHIAVFLSPHIANSGWVRAEYGMVLHKYFSGSSNRKVVPIVLDDLVDEDIPPLIYDLFRADVRVRQEKEKLFQFLLK